MVGELARRFAEVRQGGDWASFVEAVEHSAVRAGLLLAGTPQAAVEALRAEGEVARPALRELVRFAIDPAHGALRRKLELTIPDAAGAGQGARCSSRNPSTVPYQTSAFLGLRIQWFSSGKTSSSLSTPWSCSASKSASPSPSGTR